VRSDSSWCARWARQTNLQSVRSAAAPNLDAWFLASPPSPPAPLLSLATAPRYPYVRSAGTAAAAEAAAPEERSEVETSKKVPDLVLKGIEEFNKGEFYECHEYLEEAWMQEPARVRFLYQGILQVGVGFYHLKNGNWRGATGLLRNGTVRLKEFEPVTLGIDVASLVRECEQCLRELEALGRERVREFDRTKMPMVKWA
jgi:predicted metal-dependent hydrolase